MPNPNPANPRFWKYSLDNGSFDVFCPAEISADELPELLAFIDLMRIQIARVAKNSGAAVTREREATVVSAEKVDRL